MNYIHCSGTEEEAAEAYDIAAIKFRGLNAVTNFDMNRYDVKSILESSTLPIGGGAAKRLKEAQAIESSRKREEVAVRPTFQYGNPSSSKLQSYPLIHQLDQPQPLLTLQNPDISQYTHDQQQFHQSYMQPLPLQSLHPNFYHNYLQSNPSWIHGLMNMGPSSSVSVMDHNSGNSIGHYTGTYMGTAGIGMNLNSATELAMVKADYDLASGGDVGWSGESTQGMNPGVFTMWNE